MPARTAANVFTIPAGVPFADTLVRGLIDRWGGDPVGLSRITIYVPTRRAIRTLADAFARELGGAALLPDMRPLGDVDEDALLFDPSDADLTLPPEIDPVRQRFLLATLVQRWAAKRPAGSLTFAQAVSLGGGLAQFLAEAETHGVDLSHLDNLVPAELAAHWAEIKAFLLILRDQWPALLAAEEAMDPAARRNAQLAALTTQLATTPPSDPVIAAGSTGSIPATAALLKAIAHLPKGAVILPGLDQALDDSSWNSLDPGHPQFGMQQLLGRIECARETVGLWMADLEPTPREALLRETLRPAPTTDAWRGINAAGRAELAAGLAGLSVAEMAHPGDEAAAIALMLRELLEEKGKTGALVTPDRNLARRVAAELGRWNIAIDDSAGRPLAHTPVGSFLCLLADAVQAGFAPMPLLALLKHPLAAGGEAPAVFRARVRTLDRLCLRGPAPDRGLDSIRRHLAHAKAETREAAARAAIAELEPWFSRLADRLAPLAETLAASHIDISDAAAAHVRASEALAATDQASGAERLWAGDTGEAAAGLLSAIADASVGIPNIETSSYAVMFRALAEERAVRPVAGRHPRLAILGPLEARLQSFDLVVLGGLNEDSWPRAAATDAWLSRPMREKLGLEQPERAIGLAAHDFATLAAGPRVVLTRALKSEGSPTVASRWWQRLIQLTRGLGLSLEEADVPMRLARALDEPALRQPPMERPAPTPPVAKRPRSLSVTEIETWLRDPYALYAKHVLRLFPLDPLDTEIGPLERGTGVHTALEIFLREFPDALPDDADDRLIAIGARVFAEMGLPKATRTVWMPRFMRAAKWFVAEERGRRDAIAASHVEIRGSYEIDGPAGPFELRARADRIDELKAGGGAIIDYKTGNPPTKAQVRAVLAPQLPLEGAMLAAGGFAGVAPLMPAELTYIRFGGGAVPGEVRSVPGDILELVSQAEEKLRARIAEFDSAQTPYVPRVMPFRTDIPGDYDHLARVREWSLTGWEGDGE